MTLGSPSCEYLLRLLDPYSSGLNRDITRRKLRITPFEVRSSRDYPLGDG